MPTRPQDGWQLDPDAVEAAITERTKVLFLGYPCNPTGAVLEPDTIRALAALAERHDLLVISDEIYDRLVYGGHRHEAFSALPGMRERTILLGGFSKAYAMTGWRVGYACAPGDLLEGLMKVHQYIIMTAPTTAQDAAVGGARAQRGRRATHGRRVRPAPSHVRGRARAHRPAHGRAARRLLRLPRHHPDRPLVRRVLRRACCRRQQVAVVPGTAFGPSGEGYVRATLATSYEDLEEALAPHRALHRHPLMSVATPAAGVTYEPVIGIEIHVQLRTASKMFCGCSNDISEAAPNANTCPVCLGLPGALPVINREAVRHVLATGIAIGATTPEVTRWDRKNYFYPDLPKGYQISQYELPLASHGKLAVETSHGTVEVGITRAHLEEDTARLQHTRERRPPRQPARLRPLRRAAAGDRHRPGHPRCRDRAPLCRGAAPAARRHRRLVRGHGERRHARRGQRLAAPGWAPRRSGHASRSRT